MVDERTDWKVSNFIDTKSVIVELKYVQFEKWSQANKLAKMIWQDNTERARNHKLEMIKQYEKLNIQLKYTAKDTPEQNHLSELGLTTIATRAREMTSHANLNHKSWFLL